MDTPSLVTKTTTEAISYYPAGRMLENTRPCN